MKKLFLAIALLTLAGCSNGYERREFPVLPKELNDCSFFYVTNSSGDGITVVRCPNSTTSTTYHVGKTTATTVVVDGDTYVKQSTEDKHE